MMKTFYDFFPTPKFIAMDGVGVSLQNDSVCFVDLQKIKGKIILKSFGRQEFPSGVLDNGEIKDPAKLASILAEFRKKYGLYFIKVSLPDDKSFLFRISLPKMSVEEIRKALRFKVEENVPLSADEAIYDFYYKEVGGSVEVTVSVMPKEAVLGYLKIFKESGLNPLLFETEAQAVARSIIKNNDSQSFLIVNLKNDEARLYIADKGFVQFTSNINLGENFFSKSFIADGDKEAKKQNQQPTEGAKIFTKFTAGDILKNEVDKLLDYWKSLKDAEAGGPAIKKIIICGQDSYFNVKNYFNSIYSIPVEQANVWTNVFSFEDYIPELTFDDSFKYTSAVGISLPDRSV